MKSADNIKQLLGCIKQEIEDFFKNDMSIDILKIQDISDYQCDNHFTSIMLSKNSDIFISFSIDNKLFDKLFNKFFTQEVSKDEKSELIDALPDEIINTIVGLSIRNFPKEYNELELGIPLNLNKEQILKTLNQTTYYGYEIITNYGSLICVVGIDLED